MPIPSQLVLGQQLRGWWSQQTITGSQILGTLHGRSLEGGSEFLPVWWIWKQGKKQNPRISSPFLATWLSHEKFWQFDWYPPEYGSKIGVPTGKKLGKKCIVSDRPVLEATMILTHSVLLNVIGWACGSTRQRSNSQCDPVLAWKLHEIAPCMPIFGWI